LICPIIELELQLITRDDLITDKIGIPNRNKPGNSPFKNLSSKDYQKVFNKAKSTLNNKYEKDSLMMYFYVIISNIINGTTILEKPVFKNKFKGDFKLKFKVCYSLKEEVSFNKLKKEIEKIETHWRWTGDVAYKLTKFKLIKSPQLKSP
jgi:hypothetical protein